MFIRHWVVINKRIMARDGVARPCGEDHSPEALYRSMGCSHPKFFKMDKLCKWAWLGAEYLFGGNDDLYSNLDKNNIAVLLATATGCLDVDKRYLATIDMPSPALFVYTLPNIMLGEISIRHGFKGEQLCMVSPQPDMEELYFTAHHYLTTQGMSACLCGWANAGADDVDVCLLWITAGGPGTACTAMAMREIYEVG